MSSWRLLLSKQTILAQKARDDRIRSLLETMSDTFSFVHDAEPLGKVQMLKSTVLLMAQQTTECAYFIRDYAKDSSFCEALRACRAVVILSACDHGRDADSKERYI
jgi:hypothetical protein